MKIVDLSQPIYDGMPVYPGDPEVKITSVFTVANDKWAVSGIQMVTHDGTHVNVPRHINKNGKTLSQYKLIDFIADAIVYDNEAGIKPGIGIIFIDKPIDMRIAKILVDKKVKFVGLCEKFDFDLESERFLLEQGIISYEKLTNCDQLPKNKMFKFYGIPLNIRDVDGSPVRAFAEI